LSLPRRTRIPALRVAKLLCHSHHLEAGCAHSMRCQASYENIIVITLELARHESAARPYASPVKNGPIPLGALCALSELDSRHRPS
jgi:hypothetical protein